jgi:hypothetical protein
MRSTVRSALVAAAVVCTAATLAACSDPSAPRTPTVVSDIALQGGSGGGTTTDPYTILPRTAPAPDILMRESFGMADLLRPAGGKGVLKSDLGGVSVNGFWVEYPGNKNTQWLAPDAGGQSWFFTGCSEDPAELPSPLQPYGGCVVSDWVTHPVTSYPTALMPLSSLALPSAGWEYSIDGWPAPIDSGYIAVGFTNSAAVYSNLTTSGLVWLRVTDPTHWSFPLHWELRTGSLATGQVLATGDFGFSGWNHMGLRYSPSASTVTLTFADSLVGTFPVTMGTPKYVAFEGVGVLDNFVIRR